MLLCLFNSCKCCFDYTECWHPVGLPAGLCGVLGCAAAPFTLQSKPHCSLREHRACQVTTPLPSDWARPCALCQANRDEGEGKVEKISISGACGKHQAPVCSEGSRGVSNLGEEIEPTIIRTTRGWSPL